MIADRVRPLTLPRSPAGLARLLAGAGALLLAAGAALAPGSLWPNLLLAGLFLFGTGVGALYFVAIHHAAGAVWATVLRRVPEALTGLIPVGAVLVLAALAGGRARLYPWFGEELGGFKGWWLQPAFFYARAVLYAGILTAFAFVLRRHSVGQDLDRSPARSGRSRALSAAFLVVGSFVLWLAGVDWVMSLEPHWYSTVFGVYHFAGDFVAALAAVTLALVWLQRRGAFGWLVTDEHLHDLGKLLFAMTTFWMYIWYSQAMLIWYGNLAEEAIYFTRRLEGGWRPLFWANVLVNWVLPFAVLLPRRAKRNGKVLARISLLLLAGHWLDLYLMVRPPLAAGATPPFGLAEAGSLLLMAGIALLVFFHLLGRASLVPLSDPGLEASLRHHS